MNKITNVLMVGSTLDVKGGMTTVVEGFLNNEFKNSKLHYIPTHINKNKVQQMIFYLIALIKIILCMNFKNVKIVHIHFSERGSFSRKNIVLKIAKFFRKKVIIHMHGAEFKEFYEGSSNIKQIKILNFLKKSDKVIVLGNSWNEYVKSLDEKINTVIMPNFVKARKERVIFNSKNEINILFLAVITKRKGIFDLIEAIKLLTEDRKYTDYKINVIVAGTGIEESQAKQRIKELKLEKNFQFKGWVNNKEKLKLLSQSQIFVLPSYNEGLPMSILEAMSYGIPIISTSVGSIEDAIKHNHNGLIIQPGDIESLKESIGYLINNKDICITYSNNSKDLVQNIYDEKIYFSNIEKMYSTI